ncbi:hypothetical protein M408DRAFT_326853 [Serendipita vermifera MAFF 305830]|uniref:Large ribosomal subunit protein mL49 n=1 Tax=Serendipita vermifera MAFF 305830 TaxID=933852 RepID=A0A0C2XTJ0_SERVB|nr:hypothetical protein M408DRAFT_326853 [Serendipita vermifera MAFF 305830]
MQRLTKEVSRCSLAFSRPLKYQIRAFSEATTQQTAEASFQSAQNPTSQSSSTSRASLKPKADSTKRPPVAWPQRPNQDPAEQTAHFQKTAIEYPYFVPRNSNGCVPVYSDFKSNRSREITLIRNVEGDVNALKDDLVATLFPDTPNNRFWNQRLKTNIRVHHNRHVVMQGGRWANHVHKWLLARGF